MADKLSGRIEEAVVKRSLTTKTLTVPRTRLVPGDRARLTTTLNLLKQNDACASRFKHLYKSLGGTSFDPDAPINLLTILKLNGVSDCLWALRATSENCERQARLIAADIAATVLPIYARNHPNDKRPKNTIDVARQFARGCATRRRLIAACNAASAASAAVYAAVYAAAAAVYAADAASASAAATYDVAYAAADASAAYATAAAAYDADDAVYDAIRGVQARIVKRYLLESESVT